MTDPVFPQLRVNAEKKCTCICHEGERKMVDKFGTKVNIGDTIFFEDQMQLGVVKSFESPTEINVLSDEDVYFTLTSEEFEVVADEDILY